MTSTTPRSSHRRPNAEQLAATAQQQPSVSPESIPLNSTFSAPLGFREPTPRPIVESCCSYYSARNTNNIYNTRLTTTEPGPSDMPLSVSAVTRDRYVPHPPAPPALPCFSRHQAHLPQYRPSYPIPGTAPLAPLPPGAFQYYWQNAYYDAGPETIRTTGPTSRAGNPNANRSCNTTATITSRGRGNSGGRRLRSRGGGSSNASPSPIIDMMSGGGECGDDNRQWDDDVRPVTHDGCPWSASVGGASTSKKTLDDEGYYDGGVRSEGHIINEEDHGEQGLQDLDPNPRCKAGGSNLIMAPLLVEKKDNTAYYPGAHHRLQFEELKRAGTLEQRGNEGLNRLQDGKLGERPPYAYPIIIKCAIEGSPRKRLTLAEIYEAMEKRFSYFTKGNRTSWRNSVRHNLSLNTQFIKEPRPVTEPGKGFYWVVAEDATLSTKRQRKRNKKPSKRELAAAKKAEAEQTAKAAAEATRLDGATAWEVDDEVASSPSPSNSGSAVASRRLGPPSRASAPAPATIELVEPFYAPWQGAVAGAALPHAPSSIAPSPAIAAPPPASSFGALAAQLEKEGIGAQRSGGPGVVGGRAAKRKAAASGLGTSASLARKKARKAGVAADDRDDSEDGDEDSEEMDDDSDNY